MNTASLDGHATKAGCVPGMKVFEYWEWSDTVGAIALSAATCLVALIIYAICQDHSPRFFYIGASVDGFCVAPYREWTPNAAPAFCSDDIYKALEVMDRMNASLKAKK